MNTEVLKPEVQAYLKEHFKDDVSAFILKGSPFKSVAIQELAQQLTGLQKTEKKLPTWSNTRGIYFPPKLNLEQTSSEETAAYKASLFNGKRAIDLTGGFGVDTFYLSKVFNEVIHCEQNTCLAKIVTHNFKKLPENSVKVQAQDSLEFLKQTPQKFDLIYADPSRRHDVKGKVFMLADCEPNIPENLDLLFEKSQTLLIKTSPLLDIQAGIRELKYVREIHAVALKNEVKELLWVLRKEGSAKNLKKIAVNLKSDQKERVIIEAEQQNLNNATFGLPSNYIYEPHAALMKLGEFNWISEHFKLNKLAQNTHLYTSENRIDFPGRVFKLTEVLPYSKKILSQSFKNTKAHITTRNFKESVAAIRKKLKIKDGGDTYLFFTTLETGKTVVLNCKKV